MRRLLFAAAAVVVICAVVAAGEKLSRQARQKIEKVEKEIERRVGKKPLSFHELCEIESTRLRRAQYKDEIDPLSSLYVLRRALQRRVRELNPYWEPAKPPEQPEKEYKYVYKEYDITDIISLAPDKYAPMIGFGMGSAIRSSASRTAVGGIVDLGNGDDAVVGAGFDYEKIYELIERFLPEDPESRSSYNYAGGKLICYMPDEFVPALEGLLAKLRSCSGYSVNIEVKFIRGTTGYFRKLAKMKGNSIACLSAEAEKKLLEDAAKKNGVEVITSSEIIAADGQVVHIREGQQCSFLMDYDINTVGIPTLQPVVRIINEGLICQFQPKVFKDGELIGLDILASLCKFRKDPRKSEFMGGELIFPTLDMLRLRTTIKVPNGRAVLVGGTAASSDEQMKDAHMFMVYIKPTLGHRNR